MFLQIHITVVDANDNAPQFVYGGAVADLVRDQYLVAIPDATPVGATIFQIEVSRGKAVLWRRRNYLACVTKDQKIVSALYRLDPIHAVVRMCTYS